MPVSIKSLDEQSPDSKPQFIDVPVPQLNDSVRLRRMTAAEYITASAVLGSTRKDDGSLELVDAKTSVGKVAFSAVMATAIEESGAPLFADGREIYLENNPEVAVLLGLAALRFNSLLGEAPASKNDDPNPAQNSA